MVFERLVSLKDGGRTEEQEKLVRDLYARLTVRLGNASVLLVEKRMKKKKRKRSAILTLAFSTLACERTEDQDEWLLSLHFGAN